MTKDRIACVMVPNFSMAVSLRIDQSLLDQPVALVETDNESSPILAVNDIAASVGVTCDMTVARGRSYCPKLVAKVRDIKREKTASEKIRSLLFSVSPLIEETDRGCFFLDASGLNWLYKNEQELALKLVSLITPLKVPVQVGIANNKFVAKVAAMVSKTDSFTLVTAGAERRFLNKLTINYLPFSEETRDKLLALGLKTIGQVAAFPSNEMTVRFSEEGAVISRLSRGDDTDFFLPELARMTISSRTALFEPLQSTGAVIAHVEKVLTTLLEKLSRTGRGCRVVEVTLHLEASCQAGTHPGGLTPDSTKKSLRLALKHTVGTSRKFIRLLANKLNSLRLWSGRVMDITITIPETLPLVSSQTELLGASGSLAGSFLDDRQTLNDLRQVKLLFPAVHSAVIPDGSFSFCNKSGTANKPENKSDNVCCCYALEPVAGLRLLQPPQKTTVVTAGKKLDQLKLKSSARSIVEQKGPWELSGEWWKHGFDRMYYEVQTDDRQFYLLYFDRYASDWYVQGVFD